MNKVFIDPFIEACEYTFKKAVRINAELGETLGKNLNDSIDSIGVYLGINGKLRGHVIFSMEEKVACEIAAYMMNTHPIKHFDSISKSAVTEFGNIIIGKTASLLFEKGIKIEFTPPSLLSGENYSYIANRSNAVCMPVMLENGSTLEVEINVL